VPRAEGKKIAEEAPAEDAAEAIAAADRRLEPGAAPNGGEATSPAGQETPSESTNVWNDEAAESAFRAEARERGEPVSTPAAKNRAASGEENDSKNLPPLDDLVQRIPPEVRETLDDLFRARFTTVRRVAKKALKS
jgi:hypothetical protein